MKADDLASRETKLNIGSSVHEPSVSMGTLLFTVLAMIIEFEDNLINIGTRPLNEGGQDQATTPRETTQDLHQVETKLVDLHADGLVGNVAISVACPFSETTRVSV